MTEPKRRMIFVPNDDSTYAYMDSPEGDWIYDPDHKIDLGNLTTHPNRAAGTVGTCHRCHKNAKQCICEFPLRADPPPA